MIYCGEAAAFGGLALLADHFSLAAVVALAAVDGALALAGRSLTRAVVATSLEPSGELRAGNALLNVAFTGGAAIGPALAGLVVAGFGVQSALLLDAVSFYAIAWILFTAGAMPHAEPEPGRMRDRVRAGIAYVREQTVLRRLLTAQGLAFVFFAAVLPVEVVYVKETLGSNDTGYGADARQLGGRDGPRQPPLRPPAPGLARLPALLQHARGRRRLPRPRRGADPRRRLRRLRRSAAPATGSSGWRRSAPCRS